MRFKLRLGMIASKAFKLLGLVLSAFVDSANSYHIHVADRAGRPVITAIYNAIRTHRLFPFSESLESAAYAVSPMSGKRHYTFGECQIGFAFNQDR